MAVVRPGVTRLREELEAAANRPVVAVTGETGELPPGDVYVGTEAVLHRVRGVDVVAFLDVDAELLAPRYRAAEQAMALLVRAGRLVGPRSGGGRVLLQTFVPRHEVIQAALLADPARVAEAELARRRLLGLPPFRALAAVEGAGAVEFATATGLEAAATPKGALLRADTWDALGRALIDTPRPKGSRLRVAVDPPRQ
jgi:primosomal protein N' (replication factor Y)